MILMLDTVESWVDEIPLQTSSQRFGNLAFRDWGRRLEEVHTISLSHDFTKPYPSISALQVF